MLHMFKLQTAKTMIRNFLPMSLFIKKLTDYFSEMYAKTSSKLNNEEKNTDLTLHFIGKKISHNNTFSSSYIIIKLPGSNLS